MTRQIVFRELSRGILAGEWPTGTQRPAPGATFLDSLSLDRSPALFDL
jgi:hypothetical protein